MADEAQRARLETAIGYQFRRQELLIEALTHSSYSNEVDEPAAHNERLEFLGDAVLDLLIAHWLFTSFPGWPEGRLTQTRARVVSGAALCELARDLDLGQALRMGVGEERTGGRDRDSVLACAIEAVVGAVYEDAGFSATMEVVASLFRERVETHSRSDTKDPKSQLQEWAQAMFRTTPEYRVLETTGPAHATHFQVEVTVGRHVTAQGTGRSKKEAEMEAARLALEAR